MKQHSKPCSDCPWRRKCLPGWVGVVDTPEDWLAHAHGESKVDCHLHGPAQCAGMAIYRANVCKVPISPSILRLEPNTDLVFSRPAEFIEHHRKNGLTSAERKPRARSARS
jgi:hypothetical protein